MGTPDRITKLIPRPQMVSLGGTLYPIWPLRLRDLADLQGWLDDEWQDPLDKVEEAMLNPVLTAEERDDLLFDAYEHVEEGPPVDGTPEAARLYGSTEGIIAFLLVVLSRNLKEGAVIGEAEQEEIARVAAGMTTAEYLKLKRVAFGSSSLRTLTRMILGDGKDSAAPQTWAELIDHLATAKGWTYKYIYTLTIAEFVLALRNGNAPDDSVVRVYRPEQHLRYEAYLERKKAREREDEGPEEGGVLAYV